MKNDAATRVSLLIPRSLSLTDSNKTGAWSFIQPHYEDKTAPCSEACPCGQDIPRIEHLVSKGLFASAFKAILAENPLPGVCGRVCFHPCESACNRRELDEAVTINALERFLADVAAREGIGQPAPARPAKAQHIAVVGSGPAGLAAAYFLALLGYKCDILETMPEAGGLLRYGIPSYRLPSEALARDIARIEALGVRIQLGKKIDESSFGAPKAAYDAVFIAAGKSRPATLSIPGADLAKEALVFLADIRRGKTETVDSKLPVAIIGGGNTAIDTARSLKRLGARPLIVYRRRREDMPAFAEEVEAALAEGIELMELRSPLSIAKAKDGLTLKVQTMRPAGVGKDGRGRVEPVAGEESTLQVAAVYAALGALRDEAWSIPGKPLALGRCAISWKGLSGVPTAFIGDIAVGDLVPAGLPAAAESVSDAIAAGKEAAIALDAYFANGADAAEAEVARCRIGGGMSVSMELHLGGPRGSRSRRVVKFADINTDYFDQQARALGPELPERVRSSSFAEVRGTLTSQEAIEQASRCFNCGTCNDCDNCRTFCPEVAIKISDGISTERFDRRVDIDYCKGCGICVTECPRCAMIMEETQS